MKKNRYLLCLLACGLMLYLAVPKLGFTGEGPGKLFSYAWLVLALFAAAGNLSGLLYYPRRQEQRKKLNSDKKKRKRSPS